MLKPALTLARRCALLLVVFGLLGTGAVWAKGKGPVSAWPASERYVLVADKSYPGVVLVDLTTGAAIERLIIEKAMLRGIASCVRCDFIVATGASGKFYMLHLKGAVGELLDSQGSLSLDEARVEMLYLKDEAHTLSDGRMVLVTEDGHHGYLASSDDRAVYRLDFENNLKITTVTKYKSHKPFGLNWDHNGDILVSMNKRYVHRISPSGEIKNSYSVEFADCPGESTLNPNLRGAVDDPFNPGSILIMATNPKSYDGVVWRLTMSPSGRQTCTNFSSAIGRDAGWLDGEGEHTRYSRPHHFIPLPGVERPQLIIPDIDNRGLRLLDLETSRTTSVLYARDLRIKKLPEEDQASKKTCEDLGWQDAMPIAAPTGTPSCYRPAVQSAQSLTFGAAKAHCEAQGARLCEPMELRTVGVPIDTSAWSNAECSSCWQRHTGDNCPEVIVNLKTPGIHRDKAFEHSWNSGQALEIGASANSEPSTRCLLIDDTLKASAPCCADQIE